MTGQVGGSFESSVKASKLIDEATRMRVATAVNAALREFLDVLDRTFATTSYYAHERFVERVDFTLEDDSLGFFERTGHGVEVGTGAAFDDIGADAELFEQATHDEMCGDDAYRAGDGLGSRDDDARRSRDVVAAARCDIRQVRDDRFFGRESFDFVVDAVGSERAAARGIDVQDDGNDAVIESRGANGAHDGWFGSHGAHGKSNVRYDGAVHFDEANDGLGP